MADIILGIASSHTPLLTLPAQEWVHRADADRENRELNLSDGRRVTYGELEAAVGDKYSAFCTADELTRKATLCQSALDRLANEIEAAAPDAIIIVGDDQEELFTLGNQPAIAIFCGKEILTAGKYGNEDGPDWVRAIGRGYLMDRLHKIPGSAELAVDIIRGLINNGIDIAMVSEIPDPSKAAFGHAYGFIVQRLLKGRPIPIVPILLNTYYPPNVPSAARCHDIGRALRRSIESIERPLRVAIAASGGLSHFVVDEELDRRVIDALGGGDTEILRSIPREALVSGSSEILNWVLTAGAVEGLSLSWHEYFPIYRTPAGTGIGIGFAAWAAPAKG